jgi:hypothetical protein
VTDPTVVIKAAMGVARDIAEGRLAGGQVDAEAVSACRALAFTVVDSSDPLWPDQCEVARQIIAAGGIPANELSEWLAVQRRRDGVSCALSGTESDEQGRLGPTHPEPWIQRVLGQLADDDEPVGDVQVVTGGEVPPGSTLSVV